MLRRHAHDECNSYRRHAFVDLSVAIEPGWYNMGKHQRCNQFKLHHTDIDYDYSIPGSSKC